MLGSTGDVVTMLVCYNWNFLDYGRSTWHPKMISLFCLHYYIVWHGLYCDYGCHQYVVDWLPYD